MQIEPLAIVGIGCRFPGGVSDAASFWSLLIEGKTGIRDLPSDRWNAARFSQRSIPGKQIVTRAGYLDQVDQFDASFFGISPREANHMDPQQRLLLELAWEALEDAGIAPRTLRGSRTGVFVGISSFDYGAIRSRDSYTVDLHSAPGMALSIAANRLSYCLDLRGPSLATDTACSSSLAALHLACESIRSGQSDMALVGGVNLILSPSGTIVFSMASMLSPDGECYAFDSRANGFVRGEGAGIVVIKRLSRAMENQDRIYAVIRSTAMNQDGHTTALTVPGQAAQEALLQEVYAKAGVAPADIAYVEAHGTGTPVGDPIEAIAIGNKLSKERLQTAPLRIGSVKTNIGHLEAGAGIAGLIKAALVVDRGVIPPNRNFEKPNPAIPFGELNLRVVTQAEPLAIDGFAPIVGVNSFGFGGTNAHAVLEAAPVRGAEPARSAYLADRPAVLPLSARDEFALRRSAERFRRYLTNDNLSLRDVCYSAGERRDHHSHRLAVVGRDAEELRQRIDTWLTASNSDAGIAAGLATEPPPRLTFVYSGQGGQWWGMGRQLLQREPIFRTTIDEIDAALEKLAGWSLRSELLRDKESSRIDRTDIAQPAIFALQVALTRLWQSWGVSPQQVVGHSVGEVAAALTAGILTFEDAVKVILHRSRLQHQTAGHGGMAAVGIPTDKANAIVAEAGPKLEIAAINSPSLVTLAGDVETLNSVLHHLEIEGAFVRRLPINYAFHTCQMDSIRDELRDSLSDIRPRAGKIPLVSTVTGAAVDGSEMGAEYWWSNVRQVVRFAEAIRNSSSETAHAFVEIGPHPTLESSIKETLAATRSPVVVVNSLRRESDESLELLTGVGRLHVAGVPLDWAAINQSSGRYVPLPAYPWNRKTYWAESIESKSSRFESEVTPLLGISIAGAMPTWESQPHPHRFKYLQDHRLWNSIVFPAAGFAEMALGLVRHLHPDGSHVVENLRIEKALFISAENVPFLQTLFDEEDGSFAIYSSGEDRKKWERHASGRLTKNPAVAPEPISIPPLQCQRPDQIGHDELYQALGSIGYQFGDCFRNIRRLWKSADQAIAEIAAPDPIVSSLADACFHPALLDACFQACIGLIPPETAGDDKNLFLPASIKRIQLYGFVAPETFYARVANADYQDDTITADISVFGKDGKPIAEIRGFHAEKFRQRRAVDKSAISLFQFRWNPGHLWGSRAGEAPILLQPEHIIEAARERCPDVNRKYRIEEFLPAFVPQIERLTCLYIADAYRRLGWKPEAGSEFDLDQAVRNLGAVERYRGLVQVQLDALAHYTGAISAIGEEHWRVNHAWPSTDVEDALHTLRRTFPALESETILLAATGPKLADILCGVVDPVDVIFSGGSSELIDTSYKHDAGMNATNELIKEAIEAAIKSFPERCPIRILEVGGGTGSLTRAILPALPVHQTEYTFTDLGASFLIPARQKFAEFPFIKYQPFDIERSPKEQGIPLASFHLVLANDVIHAAGSVAEALEHLKESLAPGGLLMFAEVSRSLAVLENTFGLLGGWWRFRGRDSRKKTPLLSPAEWRKSLVESGFEQVTSFVSVSSDEKDAVHAIYIARKPDVAVTAEQGVNDGNDLERSDKIDGDRTLIFADRDGAAGALAGALQLKGQQTRTVRVGERAVANGDDVLLADPSREGAIGEILDAFYEEESAPSAIIYFCRLNDPDTALSEDAAGYANAQNLDVQQLRRLLRAAARRWPKGLPKLFVVSRGAYRVLDSGEAARLEAAPIVGFLRVARNEFPEAACIHIDLDPVPDVREVEDLIEEMALADGETEIAYRAGRRYVHRLLEIQEDELPLRLTEARRRDGSVIPYRLEIPRPGSISNLSLNANGDVRRAPGPDEVEVEVRAAGVNFRDLMKVLGMYPGNPEDLRWLGDDFAGVVTRVGNAVTDIGVDDAVWGVAPFSFSSHVIAHRALIARKPEAMTFAGSATLPSVFLTAHYALVHLARMQPGERVLIHSAAGGVGQAAIQVAKALGLEILATAGTPEKRRFVQECGVTHVMDSRSLRFADEVMAVTGGRGVDAVLNSLAGDFIPKSLSVLAPFGRMIEIGKVDIYADRAVGLGWFRQNISYFAVDLHEVVLQRPALIAQLLREINEEVARGRYKALPHQTFPITQAGDALRLISQAKHVGKVTLDFDLSAIPLGPKLDDTAIFRPDVFYLISGGASGVGLELVRWMYRSGARHFALLSRSGPPDEAALRALEELRSAGAEILDVRGDVTSCDDVRRAVARADLPNTPLRGIFHCAMVLNDKFITELDDEQFNRALYPKFLGAWNLHVATGHLALDHFVCFSSSSATLGLPRQANYNAGNSFLNALTQYRRQKGLPGLTIEWGAIRGAGTLERHKSIGDFLSHIGVPALSLDEVFANLRRVLARDVGEIAVAKIDWPKIFHALPQIGRSKIFEMFSSSTSGGRKNEQVHDAVVKAATYREACEILGAYLVERVGKVLSADPAALDVRKPFKELGIDSLMAVELVQYVESDLDLSVGMGSVLGSSSLTDLAENLVRKMRGGPGTGSDDKGESLFTLDLEEQMINDCRIADSIYLRGSAGAHRNGHRILLTGATGFLGAYVLRELLRDEKAEIICVVRAQDSQAVIDRICENLKKYDLLESDVILRQRVKAVAGDLGKSEFGLGQDEFADLADGVDCIYHLAAEVNHIADYGSLRDANVLSAKHVLEFAAATGRRTPIHYASTAAIFANFESAELSERTEFDRAPDEPPRASGYVQTKWVSEHVFAAARERGCSVTIYRFGVVTGDEQTGKCSPDDVLWRTVKTALQLDRAPASSTLIYMTPVDFSARTMVALSRRQDSEQQTYHVIGDRTVGLADIVDIAETVMHRTVERVPLDEWTALLLQQEGIEQLTPLAPYLSTYVDYIRRGGLNMITQFPAIANEFTHRKLEDEGVAVNTATSVLVTRYLNYLNDTGYLDLR